AEAPSLIYLDRSADRVDAPDGFCVVWAGEGEPEEIGTGPDTSVSPAPLTLDAAIAEARAARTYYRSLYPSLYGDREPPVVVVRLGDQTDFDVAWDGDATEAT